MCILVEFYSSFERTECSHLLQSLPRSEPQIPSSPDRRHFNCSTVQRGISEYLQTRVHETYHYTFKTPDAYMCDRIIRKIFGTVLRFVPTYSLVVRAKFEASTNFPEEASW